MLRTRPRGPGQKRRPDRPALRERVQRARSPHKSVAPAPIISAGATNSNLLNTYGEVTMRLEPEGPMYKTGRAFVGAIVGDHVKLAIETRLTTGAVLGTGAMIAMTGFPPAVVRRFAWLTDRGEQVYRFEKFLETARKMMARRDKEPGEAYLEAMRALHERSAGKGLRD